MSELPNQNHLHARNIQLLTSLVFLVLIGLLSLYILKQVMQESRENAVSHLQQILHNSQRTYHYWLQARFNEIETDVQDPDLIKWAEQLLNAPQVQTTLLNHPAQKALRDLMRPRLAQRNELGIFVIAPNRVSVASMRNVNVGTPNLIDEQRPDLLRLVFEGHTVLIPPVVSDVALPESYDDPTVPKQATMFVATPIKNAQGQIIAAFTRRLNVHNSFQDIAQLGWFGNTGELLAFGKKGYLLSNIRFGQDVYEQGLLPPQHMPILNLRLVSPTDTTALLDNIKKAISGQAGADTIGQDDYRGQRILSAWLWDHDLGIGLLAKIDEKEALKPYQNIQTLIVLGFSSTVLLALFAAFVTERIYRHSNQQMLEQEQKLHEADAKFRATFEQAAVGIAHTNLDGQWLRINRKFHEIIGFSPEDLQSKTFKDITHPEDLKKSLDYTDKVQDGTLDYFQTEKRYIRHDGTITWVLLTVSLAHNDQHEPEYFIVVIQDISERKKAQHALQNAYDSLEKQVAKRTEELAQNVEKLNQEIQIREQTEKDLQKALSKADAANESKSEFLANMSHEIRTPMNAIIGFSEILHNIITDPQQRTYLESIRTSSKSLLTLINDILDLSKVESGKLDLVYTPTDIHKLVRDMEQIFAIKVIEKNLDFQIDISPETSQYLLLDEVRIRQVLLNLVGNAIKFTDHGHIRLSLATQNTTENTINLTFTVEDTGIGIPKDQQRIIFDPFEQQRFQEHIHGGTGLGLAISQRLIKMMGGTISVTSEPNKGSVFCVALPNIQFASELQMPHLQSTYQQDHSNLKFEPARILVVDDIDSNRQLLQAYLKPYPFEVLTATNGAQAIDLARQTLPDLILMDMRMPFLDGYAATNAIKSNPKTECIPIVAVTATVMKESEQEIRRLCDGYLKKPIEKSELIQTLANFLPYIQPHLSDEPANTEIIDLSESVLPQSPETLLKTLKEHESICEDLQKSLIIGQIESFAQQMNQLAETHQYASLKTWSNQLLEKTLLFDVNALSHLLAQFSQHIQNLENQLKS